MVVELSSVRTKLTMAGVAEAATARTMVAEIAALLKIVVFIFGLAFPVRLSFCPNSKKHIVRQMISIGHSYSMSLIVRLLY